MTAIDPGPKNHPIPLVDLRGQYELIRDEVDAAVQRVLASQSFIHGEEVESFEREFAAYCGTEYAVGCGSGTDALALSLMALGIGPDDEVLCPAYSFIATATSILSVGARPVFCDIAPDSYNLDPTDAERRARGCRNLKAILPASLFGRVADMARLLPLAAEFAVPLIEDAAQSVGALDEQGHRAGSRGAAGCFSLYPTKNLGAYGDAGIVCTNRGDVADSIRALRSHGMDVRGKRTQIGANSRLDALQAAVLRVKLPHLEHWNGARAANAAYYNDRFKALGASIDGGEAQQSVFPLSVPISEPGGAARHVFHHYVIRVSAAHRDPLLEHLAGDGIRSQVYYPLGLHQQAGFRGLGYSEGDLPETERAARETLVLPVYAEMNRDQLDRVVDSVARFLARVR